MVAEYVQRKRVGREKKNKVEERKTKKKRKASADKEGCLTE